MNKKIIGLSIAMLFAANGAMADSASGNFVEMYGILDLAAGHVNHSQSVDADFPASVNPVSANNITRSVTGMFNGGISPSRWGIRGSEDLGNGWKAIFNLDSYINVNSGRLSNAAQSLASNRANNNAGGTTAVDSSLNGQLFTDEAWVGVKDAVWGKMTAGRQRTGMTDIIVSYDAVQDAQLFSPLGFSGSIGGGGGLTELKRQDGSLKYSNKYADFNFGAMYKVGGVAGRTSANTAYGIWGGYEADGMGIQAAYQSAVDAFREGTSTTPNNLTVTNFNTNAWLLAAKYAWGDAKLVAGYESFTLKKAGDAASSVSSGTIDGFPISNLTAAGTCFGAATTAADFCRPSQTTRVYWLGGDYNFSPAFNMALGFWNVSPKRSADANQAGGNQYYYSALGDYHFTKRTDVYAGLMYSHFSGDQFATSNSSNYIYAVGMRHKF